MKNRIKYILLIVIFSLLLQGLAEASDTLNLEKCINMALAKNLTIDIAKTQVKISASRVQEMRSAKYPNFKGGGVISKYDYQTGFMDVDLKKPVNGITKFPPISLSRNAIDGEFGVSVEQIIYGGGRINAQILAAKLEEENAELNLLSVEETVKYNVELAFYSALKAKENLALTIENAKSAEENVKLSQALFKLGIVPEVDSTSAEVALARAKLLSNHAKNEYDKSLANLNMVMGSDINQSIEIDDMAEYKALKINKERAVKKALENRIEMKQSKLKQGDINLGEISFSPTVSATAGYIVRNTDSMGRRNFFFELGVDFPVFNILAYKAKSDRSEATVEESEQQRELLKQKITLEVQTSLLDLKSAQENVLVTVQEVDLVSRALKIAEGKYREGLGNIRDLTEAQLNVMKGKTDYLEALYNYKIVIATIEHVTGTKIEEIVKGEE